MIIDESVFYKYNVWYQWFAWYPVLASRIDERRRVTHHLVWLQRVWKYYDDEYGLTDYSLNDHSNG